MLFLIWHFVELLAFSQRDVRTDWQTNLSHIPRSTLDGEIITGVKICASHSHFIGPGPRFSNTLMLISRSKIKF